MVKSCRQMTSIPSDAGLPGAGCTCPAGGGFACSRQRQQCWWGSCWQRPAWWAAALPSLPRFLPSCCTLPCFFYISFQGDLFFVSKVCAITCNSLIIFNPAAGDFPLKNDNFLTNTLPDYFIHPMLFLLYSTLLVLLSKLFAKAEPYQHPPQAAFLSGTAALLPSCPVSSTPSLLCAF